MPTFRCPLRCPHCDLWQLRHKEIEPELWRQRLTELARHAAPPLLVGISGGEPLVYGGIHQLVSACQEVGYSTALATSTLPLRDHGVRRLLAAGLSALVVSVDGMGIAHDSLRGRPGLFHHLLQTVDAVKRYSPELQLTVVTTVTRAMVGQLVNLVRWAWCKPEINTVCFHTLSANLGSAEELNPWWFRRNPLWPGDVDGLQQELGQLVLLRQEGHQIVNSADELRAMARFYAAPLKPLLRGCNQHGLGMIVLPNGAVKICPLHDPIGNIRTHSLRQIWRSDAARELNRLMRRCQRNCHFVTNFAYQRHLID